MAAADNLTIPIICGPTASGKTALALKLAERIPLEVISADSRQVIKHFNIGTAKPTLEERALVPFHLIDLVEPGERYSAFRFIDDASAAIKQVDEKGKLPLVVGGTGLYLKALTEGVVEIEQSDFSIRAELVRQLESDGAELLYSKLQEIDPVEAAKIHPNNRFRLIRALEIYYLTGRPKSEITAQGLYRKSPYKFAFYCLLPDRPVLYDRINLRVEQMMFDGFLEEVRSLLSMGRREQVINANVIGYTELVNHIDGNFSLPEAVSLIKQNSRHFAKRQTTWFRHQIKAETSPEFDQLLHQISVEYKSYSSADS